MTVYDCVARSMQYERAASHISTCITKLAMQAKLSRERSIKDGEPVDESYRLVISDLSNLLREYSAESDCLWKQAEKKGEYEKRSLENLANAILSKAAEDYEAALCGYRCESELRMIEKFAEEQTKYLTKVNFMSVLNTIRKAHPKFVRIVHEHDEDIARETAEIKKLDGDYHRSKHKCPLCGGGIYQYGDEKRGYRIFRCTGCQLQEIVEVAHD